jgi:glycosyltransferase involved in cell wall biosynthesis
MRLLMNLPSFPTDRLSVDLSLVKFLLPLAQDAAHLSASLGAIDTICHLGCLAHEIVAVDDASSDGTAAEARRYAHFMPLWLIPHSRPRGRTMAFRSCLEAACREVGEGDLLVPIDPRHHVDPYTALRAIAAARTGCEAVIASPLSVHDGHGERASGPDLVVYRARVVEEHLSRYLEFAPSESPDPFGQLRRYLEFEGVHFHRLPTPIKLPMRGRGAATARAMIAAGGRPQ